MRWLFHIVREADLSWGNEGRYAPPSLDKEGFVHASFQADVAESARLYFPGEPDVRVLAIDPRRLDVPAVVEDTPRGPMPHVRGSIVYDAVRVLDLERVADHADRVTGTRVAFAAFEGMTLLDLVGPLDAIGRISTMGFDPTMTCEVIALTRPEGDDTVVEVSAWGAWGADLRVSRYRPPLDTFDVLIVPGGLGTRALVEDPEIRDYLASFPENRLVASVCTGALLLGAAKRLRGKRATTHATFLDELEAYGAKAVRERVVDEGQLVTSGGVTAGIDLGLHVVERLEGRGVRDAIAKQMEVVGGESEKREGGKAGRNL